MLNQDSNLVTNAESRAAKIKGGWVQRSVKN